ncbi:hypothetical protein FRC02_006455 [Tulasnella sp. 418]|nr:hypothetical protein FRC02_006455 [Tulasnella sp. 418]
MEHDPKDLPPSIKALRSNVEDFAETFDQYVNCGCKWESQAQNFDVPSRMMEFKRSVDLLRPDVARTYEEYRVHPGLLLFNVLRAIIQELGRVTWEFGSPHLDQAAYNEHRMTEEFRDALTHCNATRPPQVGLSLWRPLCPWN